MPSPFVCMYFLLHGSSVRLATCSASCFGWPPAFSIAMFKSCCLHKPSMAGCLAWILEMFQWVRSRILVRAKTESWVQVADDNEKVLFTELLKAGDEYEVPDKPGLRLETGNAGALEILVDGKLVPSIGEEGAVRGVGGVEECER